MIKSYKDLEVYNKSYKLAMKIFELVKNFPKEEIYSLSSQITRSSRSISANITEGWAKREYNNVFKQHLIHALGSSVETQTWFSFALDCKYITNMQFKKLNDETDSICKMITRLHQKWK